MKAWIIPNVFSFSGLAIGLILVIMATQSGASMFEQVAVMASGIAMMGFFYALGVSFETSHIHRILKKNGLWESDLIKKKDLPK